jgi:hypothetical protein
MTGARHTEVTAVNDQDPGPGHGTTDEPDATDEFEEPFTADDSPGDEGEPPEPEAVDPPAAARGIPPTEVDPPADEPGADSRGDTDRLPPPLRARFRLRELLRRPERPGQAAVYRVRDDRGDSHVVKWYHRGHATDPRVRDLLSAQHLPHVARLTETGEAGGHPYEIFPSLGDTDLAQYLRDRPGPAAGGLVRALVEQMRAALTAVHELGVVHRDISPANIVLGSLDPADPELTLVDFSLAAYAPEERTAERGAWAGTPRYLSPQAVLARQLIHPAADWWALGMIVAELAGGRHPVRHSHPGYVHIELASRAPDLSAVTDPRLRLLCRGLLTRDPDHRWGSAQVGRWLAGDSPAVMAADWSAQETAGAPGVPAGARRAEPFPFMGREFTDPAELGMAFDTYWREMARALAHGRTRRAFVGWLRQFADSPRHDAASREELTAIVAKLSRQPGPETLVRLVAWLAPPLGPAFRGEPLGPDHELAGLAARAEDDARALSLVEDLAAHPRILPLLDTRPGGEGLAAINQTWVEARRRWQPGIDALCAEFPVLRRRLRDHPARTAADGRLAAQLLHIAAEPERCRALLDERATHLLGRLPEPVDWYGWLVRDRRDPLPLLLADRLAGLAEDEAWQARAERVAEREARRLDAEFRWAAEWLRVQELPATLGRGLGGAAAVTFPWIFVIGLADIGGLAAQATVAAAWMYAVPAAAAVFGLELWAAYRIGHPAYHPHHSLAGRLIGATGRAAGPVRRHRFLGTLALAAVIGLLLVALTVAAWAWPAGTVLAVAWWTWRRHRAWPAHRPGAADPGAPPGPAPDNGPGPGADPDPDPDPDPDDSRDHGRDRSHPSASAPGEAP